MDGSMKKAEVQQVFIYLMVILVVGTLMLVGYNAIGSIINRSCDVDLASFKADLKSDLNTYSNYGYSQTKNYAAPCSYDEICFVDLSASPTITNPFIKQEFESSTGRNIFIVKNNVTTDIGFAYEGITVENGYLCITSKGSAFNMNMEGVSRGKVKISK